MLDSFVPPREVPIRPFNEISNDIYGYRSPANDPILKPTADPTKTIRPYTPYRAPIDRLDSNLPATNEKPFSPSPSPLESLFTPTSGVLKVLTPISSPSLYSTTRKMATSEPPLVTESTSFKTILSTEQIKPAKDLLNKIDGIWTTESSKSSEETLPDTATGASMNNSTDVMKTEATTVVAETTIDSQYLFRELPNKPTEEEKPEDLDENLYRVEMSPTDPNELGSAVTELYLTEQLDEESLDKELDKLNNDDLPSEEFSTTDQTATTTTAPFENEEENSDTNIEMLEFILDELWNAALDLQKLLDRLTDPLALSLNIEFATLDTLIRDTKNKVHITPNNADKINKQVLKITSNLTIQRVRSNHVTIKKQRLENLAKLLKLNVENN